MRIDDDVYAIGDTCTHDDVSLSEGFVETDDCQIECWRHGAMFNLRTGEPETLPAVRPVPVYDVAVVDGDVVLTLDDGSLELRGLSWSNPSVQVLSGASRRRPWRLDRLVIEDLAVLLYFRRGRRGVLVVCVDAVAQRA